MEYMSKVREKGHDMATKYVKRGFYFTIGASIAICMNLIVYIILHAAKSAIFG